MSDMVLCDMVGFGHLVSKAHQSIVCCLFLSYKAPSVDSAESFLQKHLLLMTNKLVLSQNLLLSHENLKEIRNTCCEMISKEYKRNCLQNNACLTWLSLFSSSFCVIGLGRGGFSLCFFSGSKVHIFALITLHCFSSAFCVVGLQVEGEEGRQGVTDRRLITACSCIPPMHP